MITCEQIMIRLKTPYMGGVLTNEIPLALLFLLCMNIIRNKIIIIRLTMRRPNYLIVGRNV